LERGLTLALLAATAAMILLVARSRLIPDQQPLTFGLVFWWWIVLFYGALVLPASLLGAALARLHKPALSRILRVVWGTAAGWFLVLVLTNRGALRALMAIEGPERFRWLAQTGFVLALAALVATAAAPPLPRWLARLASLAAIAATAGALAPQPQRIADAGTAEAVVAGAARRVPEMRFLLIGIDGADWRYMGPLITRGELPHLAALACRGAFGPLETSQPTLSPVIWTSIATGVPPGRHGVHDFFADRLSGVGGSLPRLKPPRHLGLEWLEARLRSAGVITNGPVGSDTRRVPAYWNVAALGHVPVVVVNWWATWPAERVSGAIVSERLYFDRLVQRGGPPASQDLVSPAVLFDELAALTVLPADLPAETVRAYVDATAQELERMRRRDETLAPHLRELNYFVASFESERRIARRVVERHPDADALVLFRLVDKMGHAALKYSELVDEHPGASADELARYGGMMSEAYRAVDRAVGELMDAFGAGNVIVVSDHGFGLESNDAGHLVYKHDAAPDGVFIGAGPAFRPGRVEGLTVYDVLPLLLHLRGLPVAEDLRGHLPRQALEPAFLGRRPETRIASYGQLRAAPLAKSETATDAEVFQELRALGYIRYDDADAPASPRARATPDDARRPQATLSCPTTYR
jgi:hypothetical protein